MEHTVSYRFGRSDYIALLRVNRTLGLLGRFGRWGRYVAYALFVVVLINVINILSWSFDTVTILSVCAVAFVVVLATAPIGEFIGDRLLSFWLFPRLSIANRDCTLVFGEGGINSKYCDIEGRVPWRSVRRILETKDHFFLPISRAEMILVPRRALSPAAATELAHYIRAKVAAAANGSGPGSHSVQ